MLLLAGLLGLLAGLLINSLADDLPPDESGAGRPIRLPHCQTCGRRYPPVYWLAFIHWLSPRQRGRCGYCAAPRTKRAFIVEGVMAAGFAYLWRWASEDWARFLAAGVIVAIFVLITVIDIEHRLILWRIVWVSALILLVLGVISPERGWQKTLLGGAVGYGLVFGMYLMAELYSLASARLRGQPLEEIAFGGGDVNLAGLIGLAVGWSGVLFALFIGVAAAGAFSLGAVAVQLARRRYDPHMPFPYGPFLVLGALVMYLHGAQLVRWWFGGA